MGNTQEPTNSGNNQNPDEKKQNSNENQTTNDLNSESNSQLNSQSQQIQNESQNSSEKEKSNDHQNDKHKKRREYYDNNIYNDARSIAVKVLCRCERTDSFLEKILDYELKNENLNEFDKSLVNELSHGVIRWMRRLDWFLNGFYRGNYEKCLPEVKNTLRVAMYQILFLNKIPHFAAVNEAVEFIKKIRNEKHAGVVNGLLRTILRTLDNLVWPSREIDEVNYLGIVQSHPNWMVKRWIQRFGFDDAVKLCEANNKRPVLSIRINKLKISEPEFEKYLTERNIQFRKSELLDNFYTIKLVSKLFTEDLFREGGFSIQDISAGFVSNLVAPEENELIVDLCAAPGGKTTHMSQLMNNSGEIIAIEKYLGRLETLKRNIERLGATNVKLLHDDLNNPKSKLLNEDLIGKADKILLDAPCSGLGVLSKKPDIKWKRELNDIKELQELQKQMISNAAKYVKPGGSLIYSTCTIESEENSEITEYFLANHPDFEIDNAAKYVNPKVVNSQGCVEIFPHIHFIDGSYCVKFKKK